MRSNITPVSEIFPYVDTDLGFVLILVTRFISLLSKNSGMQNYGSSIIRSSHMFSAREAMTRVNGPIRPSRFLEEKRWPPREMIGNHMKVIRSHSLNISWRDTIDVAQPNSERSPQASSNVKFISNSYQPLSDPHEVILHI